MLPLQRGVLKLPELGTIPQDESSRYQKYIIEQRWINNRGPNKRGLFRIITSCFRWSLASIFLLSQIVTLIEVSIPFLLREIIRYIEAEDATKSEEYWTIFFVVLMVLSLFFSRVLNENTNYYQLKVGYQAKQGIRSMIYSKVMKLSPIATRLYNKGDLISLSQVDADKVTFVFDTFLDVVIIPFKILFLIISLYMFIGIALLAAIGVILIFSLANYIIAVMSKRVQRQRMR